MKKNMNVKWIILGYFVIALVTYFSMYRFEKLESSFDTANYNKKIVMGVE